MSGDSGSEDWNIIYTFYSDPSFSAIGFFSRVPFVRELPASITATTLPRNRAIAEELHVFAVHIS